MDMNIRAKKRLQLWRMGLGSDTAFRMLCLWALLTAAQLSTPILLQSDQPSITSAQPPAVQSKVAESKPPAKPQKELPPMQVSAQESRPAQPNTQTAKSEESKAKKDNGEEGTEKEKESTGRNAGSSLILTVKLA